MRNRRRALFRRKNNTVLYVNLYRECATVTRYFVLHGEPGPDAELRRQRANFKIEVHRNYVTVLVRS